MNFLRRVNEWFMGNCPPERLAALRVAVGGFGTLYVLARLPEWFYPLGYSSDAFSPVGLLSGLATPPAAAWIYAGVGVALAFGVMFTLGIRTAWSGPLYALALLLVTTYRNSWGMLFHVEHLLVLHTCGLALAPVGLAWSLDARRRPTPDAPVSGWSLRLLCLLTVISYVVAGVAKLRLGGLEWAMGDVMREHVAYDALRKLEFGGRPSPLGPALVAQSWLFPPLAWLTLLIELGAPLALLGSTWARAWCLAAWAFHAGVLLLMGIVFPYPLLFVAYLPFFPVERWIQRLRPSR